MLKWLSLTAEANNPRRITKRESPATPRVEVHIKAAAPAKEITGDFAVMVIFKILLSLLEFLYQATRLCSYAWQVIDRVYSAVQVNGMVHENILLAR